MMQRVVGWEDKLAAAEREVALWSSWEYGKRDCLQSVLAVIEAITGHSLKHLWRYTSKTSAARLHRGGLVTTAKAWADNLGLVDVPPKLAMRGDPLVALVDEKEILGFIGSRGVPVIANGEGLREVAHSAVLVAWRIPCRRQ